MKPWWQSKTVWINTLVGVLTALEMQTEMLKPYLPGQWFLVVAVALPVVNIWLRFMTTQPVGK